MKAKQVMRHRTVCTSKASCVRWALVLMVWCFPGQGAAQPLDRFTIAEWPSTTYYLGFPYFEASVDGHIRITAGGRYTLYLNGDLVGEDDDPGSVETYSVSFKRRENQVGVVVEHRGVKTPYGLFCVVDAQEEGGPLFVSSPVDRMAPWFWTGYGLENEPRASWTRLGMNKLDGHEENGEPVIWRPVQAGTLSPTEFEEFADLDLSRVQSVAGFPGGLDGSGAGLRLRSLEGQNLAYASSSTEPNLIDGNISTPKSFGKGVAALLQWVEVDLQRLYPINHVRAITQPPSRGTYEEVSLRGYSVRISKDGISYLEVGSRNGITTYQESSVSFPTTVARYVRLTVTEFANRNASPRLGELEVFGEGIDPVGSYVSPPLHLGTEELKDFDRVRWFGDVPSEADLVLRFRSGDDGETWSPWSPSYREDEVELTVPEPTRYLQFQVTMKARDLFEGPRLDSLVVTYSVGHFPASRAMASISPVRFPMGVDTTFTYALELDVEDDDEGIARLAILTPWPATFDPGRVEGLGAAAIDEDHTYATSDSLVIAFDPPIGPDTGTGRLVIPFQTRLLSADHAFLGLLYGPGSSIPLRVQEKEGTDPATGGAYTVTVEATDFLARMLDHVGAYPPVFSPNGDQVHDDTVFGFSLSKVSEAPVRIEIYDLRGALVRNLWAGHLNAGYYTPMGNARSHLPGHWDGRDDDGKLLSPGVYLYSIVVDVDPDEERRTGVVSLIY